MSLSEEDFCVHCKGQIVGELFIELPDGDRIHRHCEEDYEESQAERSAERAFEDEQSGGYSGAEVWSR